MIGKGVAFPIGQNPVGGNRKERIAVDVSHMFRDRNWLAGQLEPVRIERLGQQRSVAHEQHISTRSHIRRWLVDGPELSRQ